MTDRNLTTRSGYVFLLAGVVFLGLAVFEGQAFNYALGAVFIALGAVFVAKSRAPAK